MEEEKKDGYTAEGRKLRPRRAKVSGERVYDSSSRGEGHYSDDRNSGYNNTRGSYEGHSSRERGSYQGGNYEGGRGGGYSRSGGHQGGNYGSSRGGYQGGSREGGYRNNDRGGYQKREGGYQGGSREGGYQGGRDGGYQKREGGYSQSRQGGGRQGGYQGSRNSGGYSSSSRPGGRTGGYQGSRDSQKGGYSRGGGRPYQGKPQGRGGKPYGNKPYQLDNASMGMSKMLARKPQVDRMPVTEDNVVAIPVKEEVRLNKFIANSGVCSRREADLFIQAGVVTVNGEVVTELGTKINTSTDDVRFNGERIHGEEKVYLVMNKPKGYVTTVGDPHAEKTVMDLLKGCKYRVFPVGRLDKNTTGVIMFTNDGEIAERLTHPAYNKKKIYQVTLDNPLTQEDYEKILSGITLGDGDIKADELEFIDPEDHRKLGIEIHSGRNRIVRRIFESLGYDVKALDRVYFAGLTKKGLKKGEWRFLTKAEANVLKMGAYV